MEKLREISGRGLRAYNFVVQQLKSSKKLDWKDRKLVHKANVILNSEIHKFVINDLKGMHAKSVLEIGCGDGSLLKELSREKSFANSGLFGIDKSPKAIARARRASKMARPVHFGVGRNNRIPYADKFDLISTVLSFHEWKNGNRSIPYILSKLNKKGLFLIYDTLPVRIKGRRLLQRNSMLVKATFIAK